MTEKR